LVGPDAIAEHIREHLACLCIRDLSEICVGMIEVLVAAYSRDLLAYHRLFLWAQQIVVRRRRRRWLVCGSVGLSFRIAVRRGVIGARDRAAGGLVLFGVVRFWAHGVAQIRE